MIGGMATVFGCFKGRGPRDRVLDVGRALVYMGADELVLGDTT